MDNEQRKLLLKYQAMDFNNGALAGIHAVLDLSKAMVLIADDDVKEEFKEFHELLTIGMQKTINELREQIDAATESTKPTK